ncbi:hypothetical protein PAMC26510_12755 [Caballeronia sordidicola]|uniref:Uncharacterized protein n=1 Tax=Caballeronia sordidicola TaxID=196367 RepID=A0A242MX49_CABSO|nr:hypothetical protein PAMC26510_12755 [Caballeronia sordidicola]
MGRCRSPSSRSLAALAAAVVRISRLPAILANNYSIHRSGQSLLLARRNTRLADNSLGIDFQANRPPSDVRNNTYLALPPSCPATFERRFSLHGTLGTSGAATGKPLTLQAKPYPGLVRWGLYCN